MKRRSAGRASVTAILSTDNGQRPLMIHRLCVLIGLPLFVAAAPACGSSSTAGPALDPLIDGSTSLSDGASDAEADVPEPATIDEACGAYADALCNLEASCGKPLFDARWQTRERCTLARRQECRTRVAGTEPPALPSVVARCAAAMAGQSCDDLDLRVVPAACDWRGPRPADARCGVGTQCASGYCPGGTALACSSCRSRSGAGESCSRNDDCEAGLTCPYASCVRPARRGEPCGATPCAPDLTCTAGKCVPDSPSVRQPNQACDPLTNLAEERCAGGYCSSDTSQCILAEAPGEPCETPDQCMWPFFVCTRTSDGSARCAAPDVTKCE